MWSILRDILNYESGKKANILQIHFSNYAIDEILKNKPGVFALHHMYEDGDLYGNVEAHYAFSRFVEHLLPGRYVLIDTGDYIYEFGTDGINTYDPEYNLYLVAIETFNKYSKELKQRDDLWREECWEKARGNND